MKKRAIKSVLVILCFVLLGTTFTACGDGYKGERITVWSVAPLFPDWKNTLKINPTDSQALFTKSVVEKFETDTGIKVNLVDKGWGEKLNENLTQALNANTAGDIVVGEKYLRTYIEDERFAPLNLSEEMQKDIIPQMKNLITYEDKIYAAPVWTGAFGLTVNKKVLRESGILKSDNTPADKYTALNIDPTAPLYWDDVLLISKDIKKFYMSKTPQVKDKGGMLISKSEASPWRTLAYMRTAGGEYVDKENKVNVDTAENLRALQMMYELFLTSPDGSISSVNDHRLRMYLFNSKAAYIVDGIDTLTRAASYGLENDLISSELPTFKENGVKANVIVGSGSYSIVKGSKNYDNSMKFINFLLSDWVQKKLMDVDLRVPVRTSILESEEIKNSPVYKKMQPYLMPFRSDISFDGGLPAFRRNSSLIWERWSNFMNDAFKPAVTVDGIAPLLTSANTAMIEIQNRK